MKFEIVEKSEATMLAEQLLEHLMSGRRPDDATTARLVKMLQEVAQGHLRASHQESNQLSAEERALQNLSTFLQSRQGRPVFKSDPSQGVDAHDVRASGAVIRRISEMVRNRVSIVEISRGIDYLNEFDTSVGGTAFGLRFDTQFNRELRPLLLRFMADFVPRTANDLAEYSRIWQRLVDLNKERRELLFKFEKGDLDALEEARQIMQQSLK